MEPNSSTVSGNFPYKIPNTSLSIRAVKSYSGIFIEDGSDKEISLKPFKTGDQVEFQSEEMVPGRGKDISVVIDSKFNKARDLYFKVKITKDETHWIGVKLADEERCLNDYLNDIQDRLEYKAWFFGHHHKDVEFEKHFGVYERVLTIGD